MYDQSIKKNSILNVIKTVSSIVFPLITFPYVSRVLLPENVGKINFGSSVVSYFSLIASLGITTYAIRECSVVREDKDLLSKRASEIFSINICTTVISYILLALTLCFFKKLHGYRTLIIIQSTVILFTTLGTDWLNSAMEDFSYITIRTVIFQLLSLVLMFLFVKEPGDYIKYACITVISSSGANIANIFYRKRYCKVFFSFRMHLKDHISPICFLFVMILAQTIFSNTDTTMLGLMIGDFEVGIYSTAYKIENIIAQVVSSLAWVVMPRLSFYFAQENYERINEVLRKVFMMLMLIGLPSIAGVIGIAEEIVQIVGGESYLGSVVPLIILMFAFAFSLVGGSFLGNMVLLPSGNEKTYMVICLITALLNIVLNYLLIPFFGASAAAFTTAVSSFLIMVLLIIKKDKRVKMSYLFSAMRAPLVGSFCIFIFCSIIKALGLSLLERTAFCIIGSIILYFTIQLVMKNEICIELFNYVRKKFKKHA